MVAVVALVVVVVVVVVVVDGAVVIGIADCGVESPEEHAPRTSTGARVNQATRLFTIG